MEKIPLKVWNRIDMLQAPIAAQVQTGDPETRRWVTILPRASSPSWRQLPEHQYCIWDQWYNSELLQRHAPDGNEDYARTQDFRYYVNTEEELYAQLAELSIIPGLFNAPWHVQHPFF